MTMRSTGQYVGRNSEAYSAVHDGVGPGRRGCYHPRPPQSRTCRFPASGSSRESFVARGVVMDDPWAGQWIAFEERVEAVPREDMRTRSSGQPPAPRPCGLPEAPVKLRDVPGDAVVGIMAYELRRQPCVLERQRPVAVFPTPVVDRIQHAGEPALGGSLPHHVLALLRFRPGVGEAEKVERRRLAIRRRATLALGSEVDEARLVGMKRKPKPSETFAQHLH